MEITEVQSSGNGSSVTIKTKKDSLLIEDTLASIVTNLISNIYLAAVLTNPNARDTFPLAVTPEERFLQYIVVF
jgi:hypothetical protein